MITKDQALTANEFHYCGKKMCCTKVGRRGDITTVLVMCRRNGKTQTWKRDTARFRVPVKHGLYEYGEITQDNAADWHTAKDCPLNA